MSAQVVAKESNNGVKAVSKVNHQERVLTPLVNIIETETGFTLTAEMAGVPKENIQVNVENSSLVLEGVVALDLPDNLHLTYSEMPNVTRYRRVFTLSRDLDASKIEAVQKNGVLTVAIPKAEHAQPRKIQVQVG
ncbi:MAG: Hsp20/alpha crystallin family protein [Thiofilum sp.]|uniref:Hsp20/alpha crystallin family protein n=1 Tax=Thiofilum sp. TaxID=2212733 RepID=UPI0025F9BB9B|nr:Hsp20/alpha crystallin family protein [Thiofilum sp.]MBK8453414.1 Hsp20/alpha crystallin family protein [Thiofilum sp.]